MPFRVLTMLRDALPPKLLLRVQAALEVHFGEVDEDKIRSGFEQSNPAILPLETQVTFTNELIDEMVNRLCGPTPEEIKIADEDGH